MTRRVASGVTGRALLLVGLGGAAGSALRAAVMLAVPAAPLAATLLVNVVGSFVLGFQVGGRRRQATLLLVGTGFCGGFTTFSALAVQSAELARGSEALLAAVYGLVTLSAGAVAAVAGVASAGLALGGRVSGPPGEEGPLPERGRR